MANNRTALRMALALAGMGTSLVPSAVSAQVALDWEVSGSVAIGVTDNVAGTPEPAATAIDGAIPETDGFGTVSPGVRLQLETTSATHTLSYGFGYSYYFLHSEANQYSNSLNYGLRVPVGPSSEVTIGLSGGQSTVAAFALAGPAAGTQVQATPGSNNMLVSGGLGQGFTTELTPTISFGQALQASYTQTIIPRDDFDPGDDSRTVIGSFSLQLTKEFIRDRVSAVQSNDGQWTPRDPGTGALPMLQLLQRARVEWIREISDSWTSQVGLGAVVAYDAFSISNGAVAQPSGGASIVWRNPLGNLSLAYAHDATPNVLLGQATLNDSATLQGSILLPKGFDLGGSTGAQVTRTLMGPEGPGPAGLSYLADLAVGWIPDTFPVRIEARYQVSRQLPFDPDEPAAVPTLNRQSALLTSTFAWPGSPAAGGAAPFVIVQPTGANPDIIGSQAPKSARALDDEARTDAKEKSEAKKERDGGD